MTTKTVKKIFKHGGSYAVDLPMEFVKHTNTKEVVIQSYKEEIHIFHKTELDSMEDDPLFAQFAQTLAEDAFKNPKKLHDANKIWDKEWDKLLKGVSAQDE